jgi:hypothetical protein
MSRSHLAAALVALAFLSSSPSEGMSGVRHHHHGWRAAGFNGGLAPGVAPNGPIIDQPGYGATYSPGAGGISRESGGINSRSNDFGTSGVLGHTNGMPVGGHW